jgi:PucR-like helix-turn-helix protein/diguanylate cyclase with GGDEF domain
MAGRTTPIGISGASAQSQALPCNRAAVYSQLMDKQDVYVPRPQGAVLASALVNRLPALTDELLKRVLEPSDIRGKWSDIYGDEGLVPIDDLYQSLQDNLTFVFTNLGRPGAYDLAGPRRTGRRRAEQGAPLAAVQSSYQAGFRFLWDTLVTEAHQTGIVSDAELVDIASDVWMLNTLFGTELATAYRDAMTEQLLCQDQERSALVEALLEGRIADTATLWEAADLLGLPYQGVFVVVAAEVPAVARHALPRVESRLQVRGFGSAWRLMPEFQVGIVSLRAQRNTPALVEILRPGAMARVGVSPVYTGLERTSQALHLARIAMASSPAGDPTVTVFDDAPLPVLVASSPTTSYRVTSKILGPLLDINPDERDMLLDTLAAFFEFQGSAVEAGKHLYCHPNTVRHRLHRIERQTGRSLRNPKSSAELFVAMEALRRLPVQSDSLD